MVRCVPRVPCRAVVGSALALSEEREAAAVELRSRLTERDASDESATLRLCEAQERVAGLVQDKHKLEEALRGLEEEVRESRRRAEKAEEEVREATRSAEMRKEVVEELSMELSTARAKLEGAARRAEDLEAELSGVIDDRDEVSKAEIRCPKAHLSRPLPRASPSAGSHALFSVLRGPPTDRTEPSRGRERRARSAQRAREAMQRLP